MACKLHRALLHCAENAFIMRSILYLSSPSIKSVTCCLKNSRRLKSRRSNDSLSSIIQPLPVKPASRNTDDINIGEELTGALKKGIFLDFISAH